MTNPRIEGAENITKPAISLFFPAHNEESNIGRAIESAVLVLDEITSDYEIIIIDDGSTDATREIVSALAESNHRIRLILHPENRGYGGALISGFSAAKLPWVFFTDGDNQFDLHEINRLLPYRDSADLIIGYRIDRKDHPIRRLNAFGWRMLIWLLLGVNIRDVDCAFKLIRREVLESIDLTALGAVISAELLAKSKNKGFRIKEIGVSHFPRTSGAPSGGNLSVILKAFKELFQLKARLKAEK